ncbi:MAG: hypothetical protein M3454_11495 [Actinomycetota bacterium]|nr:hypothetical protein [Actinomycetota bacterium]
MAFLSELVDKSARPAHDIRAERLPEWAHSIEGSVPSIETQRRSHCKIAGAIQNIHIDRIEGSDSIEASVNDVTGRMVVRWLGRQELYGIRLGWNLIFESTLGEGSRQQLQVLNPESQLLPAPKHGR